MINFMLLISRQGKTRLTKWFVQMSSKVIALSLLSKDVVFFIFLWFYVPIQFLQEKTRAVRELSAQVLSRPPKMCNFIEWQGK